MLVYLGLNLPLLTTNNPINQLINQSLTFTRGLRFIRWHFECWTGSLFNFHLYFLCHSEIPHNTEATYSPNVSSELCPKLLHHIHIDKRSLLYICSAESINLGMLCDELLHWQLHPYCVVYHHISLRSSATNVTITIQMVWLLTLICPRCPWIVTTSSSMGRRRGGPWTQGSSSATSTWAPRWSWPSGCPNFPYRWSFLTTISATSKAGGCLSCPTEGETLVACRSRMRQKTRVRWSDML